MLCMAVVLFIPELIQNTKIYGIIHKSVRDFRPLRYSSRDGHAEGEHVNRKRDTKKLGEILCLLI